MTLSLSRCVCIISTTVKAKKSEMKAARTLGVVVVVFLLCSCPYYSFAVASVNNLVGATSSAIENWLLYFNSCLNPVIYVFFYPWFRKSIKHIVTLQILQPETVMYLLKPVDFLRGKLFLHYLQYTQFTQLKLFSNDILTNADSDRDSIVVC
uniref:G-protein coupled receptors family 1 profile domain-containing protein n=1 Tax=Seriola dumerili TaxID=41447 RepID=A0A3B4US27_SERDU